MKSDLLRRIEKAEERVAQAAPDALFLGPDSSHYWAELGEEGGGWHVTTRLPGEDDATLKSRALADAQARPSTSNGKAQEVYLFMGLTADIVIPSDDSHPD